MGYGDAVNWIRNHANVFKIARENVATKGLSPEDSEVALAIGALLENYPYGTHDVNLSQLPADSQWVAVLEKIWAKPPGLREHAWGALKTGFPQPFQDAVSAAHSSIRSNSILHPWLMPW